MDEKNISKIEPLSPELPSYEGPPKVKKEQIGKEEGHTFKRPAMTKKDVHKGVEAFLTEQRKARKDAEIKAVSTEPKEVLSYDKWKVSRGIKEIKKTRVTEFLGLLQSSSREEKFIAVGKGELQKVNKATPWLIRKLGLSQGGKSIQIRTAFRTIMNAARDEMKIPTPYRNLKDTLSLLNELKNSSWSKAVLKRNRTISAQFNKVFTKASNEAIAITKESLKDIQKGIEHGKAFPDILAKLHLLKANPIAQHAFNVDKTLKKSINQLYDQQASGYVKEQLKQIEDLSKDNPGASAVFDELHQLRLNPVSKHIFKKFPTLKYQYDKIYNRTLAETVAAFRIESATNLAGLDRDQLLKAVQYAGKEEKKDLFAKSSPNVVAAIKQFNEMAHFVESKILEKSDIKERALELEKWVKVAEKCFKSGDINNAYILFAALQSSPIHRLEKTRALFSREGAKVYERFTNRFAEMENDSRIAELQHYTWQRPATSIPYLGWTLRMLTLIPEWMAQPEKDVQSIKENVNEHYKLHDGFVKEKIQLTNLFTMDPGKTDREVELNKNILYLKLNFIDEKIEGNSMAITEKENLIKKYEARLKSREDQFEKNIQMTLQLADRATSELERLQKNDFTQEIKEWKTREAKWDDQTIYKRSLKIEPRAS